MKKLIAAIAGPQHEYNSEEDGIQIDWTFKTYALYTSITLGGFGIVIGWFKITGLLMGLAR